jgi:uncharacterized protein (DUF2164 family)
MKRWIALLTLCFAALSLADEEGRAPAAPAEQAVAAPSEGTGDAQPAERIAALERQMDELLRRLGRPVEPQAPLDTIEKRLAEVEDDLEDFERKLADLERRVGGGRGSSGSFDSIERRLRDLERDVDDLERQSRR